MSAKWRGLSVRAELSALPLRGPDKGSGGTESPAQAEGLPHQGCMIASAYIDGSRRECVASSIDAVPNTPAVFLIWAEEGAPYLARTALPAGWGSAGTG